MRFGRGEEVSFAVEAGGSRSTGMPRETAVCFLHADPDPSVPYLFQYFRSRRRLLVSQVVQDSMDFWLPANNLGITTLNDGVIGALG